MITPEAAPPAPVPPGQDGSLLSWDNQQLIEFSRPAACRDTLRYEHRNALNRLGARDS
jgi:hypothetical protein